MFPTKKLALFAAIGFLALPGLASAEQVRFRFVPIDAVGHTQQQAIGPEGAIGERITGIGLIPKPYRENFKPNFMVTYRHPYTGRNIIVPMTLPSGSKVTRTGIDRIIYDNGAVEVRFLPDGQVDTIYRAGPLRPIQPPR